MGPTSFVSRRHDPARAYGGDASEKSAELLGWLSECS